MKPRQIIFILFFAAVFFYLSLSKACAQEGAYVAEFICEYAKNLYDQGILEEAKHEFSKALIIDPDNVMAKSYLKKMGLDTGKYQVERPDLAVAQLVITSPASVIPPHLSGAASFLSSNDSKGSDELIILNDQMADLKKQIHALQEIIVSKEGNVEAKEKEVLLLKEKFISAQEKFDQLHRDSTQRDQLLTKLKSRMAALEASSAKQLDFYKTKLEVLESSISKVSADMQQDQAWSQQAAAQEFSKEVAGFRAQLDVLQREADGKDEDITRMKDMLRALEMASATQIKKYQDALEKLEGSAALQSDEAGAKQRSMEMLAQELALSENQSKSLQEELALKNRQLEEVKTKVMSQVELSEKLNQGHEQEMDALGLSLAASKKELLDKEAVLRDVEKKLVLAEQENIFLKKEVSEKTGKTKDLVFLREKTIQEKEEDFRRLSVQSERLKLEVDKLTRGIREKEEYVKRLKAEFENYKERLDVEIHGYRKEIKSFESAIAEKDKSIRQRQESAAVVDKEIKTLRQELEASYAAREDVFRRKDDVIKRHVQELAYAQGELKSLKEAIETKDQALRELSQKLEDQIFSSNKKFTEQKEKADNLERSLVLKDEVLQELGARFVRTQKEFDELRGDINGKEGQLSVLNEQTNALKVDTVRQLRGYEEEVKNLKDSLAIREKEVDEKQASIERLNDKLVSAANELAQLRSDASGGALQVRQLKQEIETLKDILGSHFQTYDDQISTLRSSFSPSSDLKDVQEQMKNLAVASGRQLKMYHEKLKILKSSLEESQKNLELKNSMITAKDTQMQALHMQIMQAQEALTDLGGQVVRKESQMKNLKGRLLDFMRASVRQFKVLHERQGVLKRALLVKEMDLNESARQAGVVRAALKQKDNDLCKLSDDLTCAKKELRASQEDIVCKDEAIVKLKDRVERLAEAADQQLYSHQKEIELLKEASSHRDRFREAQINGLKEKESLVSELTDKLNQLQKDADTGKHEMLMQEAHVKELEAQFVEQKASLENEVSLYKGRLSVMESFRKDQDEVLAQKQEAIEALAAAKGELEAVLRFKDEALKTNSLAQEQLDSLQKEASDKSARLEDSERAREVFERQMAEYQQRIKTLESAFAVKKDDYNKQELLAKELAGQFARVKEQLEEAVKTKETALKDAHGKLRLALDEMELLKKEVLKKEADLKNLSLRHEAARKADENKTDAYEQQLKFLRADYNKDRNLLKEKEKSVGDYRLIIKSLEEEAVDAENRAKRHQADLVSRDAEIENLKNSLKEFREKALRYEDQSKALGALLSDKNFQLQTAQGKVDGQAAIFGQQLAEYKNKIVSLETALEVKNKEAVDKGVVVDAKNAAMEAVEDDYARAKIKIGQLQDELSVKDDMIRGLKDKMEGAGGPVKEYAQKVSSLENLLAAKDKDLQEKNSMIASRAAELADTVEKLTAAEKDLIGLKRVISDAAQKERELERTKKELSVLNKGLAVSGEQDKAFRDRTYFLENSLEVQNAALEESIRSHKEKDLIVKNLYAKVETLEKELKAHQLSVMDKDAQFKKLKEEIKDLAGMADQQKKNYKNNIGTLEASMASEEKLKQLNSEIETLASSSSRQLEMYRDQLGILESALSGRDARIQKQELQISGQRDELTKIEAALKDLSSKFEQAQAALGGMRSELSAKDSLIEGYKERIKGLAAAAGHQLKGHKDLLDRLSGKNEKLESLIEEKDEMMKAREDELNATMEQLRQSLKSEIKDYQAKLDMAQKGIVVGVLADVLFASGSADMSPEGKKVLAKISEVLKKIPNHNHIVVEGHTDNVPIRYSRWNSNWELSSQRALSVLEYLIQESNLDPMRFSAQGYGEYRPVAGNDTDSGKKQNRRVEIVIQPQFKKVDAQELPVLADPEN